MSATEQSNPPIPREAIEQTAREILRKHGLLSIPVNPLDLATKLGMAVHNAKFFDENLVGMIAKKDGKMTLLVKGTDPPFRKRFTIAHELGHHFLHLAEDGEFVDGEADLFRNARGDQGDISPEQRREIQANMFAAALLMPSEDIRSEYKRVRSVSKLARRFNVSEEAIGGRLDQLGLLDADTKES